MASTECLQVSPSSSYTTYVHLDSHVLWTQGEKPQRQPYKNLDSTKYMIYNGDIYSFSGFHQDVEENSSTNQLDLYSQIASSKNDGVKLFNLIRNFKSEREICNLLGNLQGPFAFILVDITQQRMWFARDFFGRESLLFSYETNENDTFTYHISSVSVFHNVVEVPTSGLFCYNFDTKEMALYPYSHSRASISTLEQDFSSLLKMCNFVSKFTISDTEIDLHFSTKLKLPEVQESIELDNSLLATLIDTASLNNIGEDFIQRSIDPLSHYVEEFITHLTRSVQRRISILPPFCKNCIPSSTENDDSTSTVICDHSKVGILFSGGLDSTVIAYLAAEAMPTGSSLDLINVAFSRNQDFSKIPDRETALASYKMLSERFKPQGKRINLVLVNVGKSEVEEMRKERIKHLISPLKSVLDDSLGVCLWFAARGIGKLYNSDSLTDQSDYISPIRVVLLGSGADELLGGYGRHRSAYEKLGWQGLGSEMQLDFDRISLRNMGRDNRVVSDHGICPRIPFLDEYVVNFLTANCDLWVKCCPVNIGPLGSRGSGEKLLLRAVGAKLFGEQYLSLALFPKRAMQFGSKIAKLEDSKEKGGDSCQRLL
jgi:asparagine synthetase B (glutamine-hydrolysing)